MNQDSSPIIPSPELVQAFLRSNPFTPAEMNYEQFIATRFARWGADQELEACRLWVSENCDIYSAVELIQFRRPKPLSLKEQSIALIDKIQGNKEMWQTDDLDVVRRALESLPS